MRHILLDDSHYRRIAPVRIILFSLFFIIITIWVLFYNGFLNLQPSAKYTLLGYGLFLLLLFIITVFAVRPFFIDNHGIQSSNRFTKFIPKDEIEKITINKKDTLGDCYHIEITLFNKKKFIIANYTTDIIINQFINRKLIDLIEIFDKAKYRYETRNPP